MKPIFRSNYKQVQKVAYFQGLSLSFNNFIIRSN